MTEKLKKSKKEKWDLDLNLPCVSGLAHGQVDGEWAEDSGFQYYISSIVEETTVSWHVARGLCQQNGGDLASVHSDEENAFITQLVCIVVTFFQSSFNLERFV